jgi:hypothetical protein
MAFMPFMRQADLFIAAVLGDARSCRVEWVHEISGDEGWPAAGLLAGAPAGWLPHGGVGRLVA